jgi:2-phospho-L-lactate/phosphoenolpyruvate guanylyltransferase
MWIVLPVKHLQDSKSRLKDVLSDEQRSRFSYLLLIDTLDTLASSKHIQGITIISSDQSISILAEQINAEFILTDKDSGYSADVKKAVFTVSGNNVDKIAIIATDLPQLSHSDLEILNNAHHQGITLCPAEKDGGTNALIFSPPLTIPLLFGANSFKKHLQVAKDNSITVNVVDAAGVKRDIDRPDDLQWLREQTSGGKAWCYVNDIFQMVGVT